jgi:KIF-binding protein
LETKIKNLISAIESKPEKKQDVLIYKAILGFVYKDIGRINVYTEEISNGEKYFLLAIKLLEDDQMSPVIATVYLDNLNQLGLLWSARSNSEESKKYLNMAEVFYKEYKGQDPK